MTPTPPIIAEELANETMPVKSPYERETMIRTLCGFAADHSEVTLTFWDGEIRLSLLNNAVARELILEPRNYDMRVFDYTLYLYAWAPDAKPDSGEVRTPTDLLTLLNRLLPVNESCEGGR